MAQKPWTQAGTTESILYRKLFQPLHLHTSADDMGSRAVLWLEL